MQALFMPDFKTSMLPFVLKEVFLDAVYDPFLRGHSNMTIVDAGANLGVTSLYFRDYARRVIAVEPSAKHIEAMQATLDYNKADGIEIAPYALSDIDGESSFYTFPNNDTMGSLVPGEQGWQKEKEKVQTIRLSTLFEKYGIGYCDFMKLDIEGGEGLVLLSEDFEVLCPKIKTIVGEWHSWCKELSQEGLATRLRSLGYSFQWLQTEATMFSARRY